MIHGRTKNQPRWRRSWIIRILRGIKKIVRLQRSLVVATSFDKRNAKKLASVVVVVSRPHLFLRLVVNMRWMVIYIVKFYLKAPTSGRSGHKISARVLSPAPSIREVAEAGVPFSMLHV